jgi:glycosyltransferase involved in cell wall biosynthesis
MNIIYFVDNKLGGVTSLNYNLATNPPSQKVAQWVVHLDLNESDYTRANLHFPIEREIDFRFSAKDNYYAVLKRLRAIVPPAEGALVLNYDTEMAMLDQYTTSQTTFQLVHDDYNVTLAKQYGHIVDVFICHNTVIYKKLLLLFPERKDTIFYLPHGVPISSYYRQAKTYKAPLKLLFLGRMASSKGIFDLPVINNLLRKKGVVVEWLCIGSGPELEDFKLTWNPSDKVQYVSPSSNEEVLKLCAQQDVFVLPTKFEGSPVSLLETMSVGLVPVISNIPGGITDIVNSDIGFLVDMDNNIGFANAIAILAMNRTLLNQLGSNCRKKIVSEFDVKNTSQDYFRLFLRYKEFYREKKIRKRKVGARLDHPLIPSPITRLLRALN